MRGGEGQPTFKDSNSCREVVHPSSCLKSSHNNGGRRDKVISKDVVQIPLNRMDDEAR